MPRPAWRPRIPVYRPEGPAVGMAPWQPPGESWAARQWDHATEALKIGWASRRHVRALSTLAGGYVVLKIAQKLRPVRRSWRKLVDQWHDPRSPLRRNLRLASGWGLILMGIPFALLPLPIPVGPGTPLILFGLSMVVRESAWAQGVVAHARAKYPKPFNWLIATGQRFFPRLARDIDALTDPDRVLDRADDEGKRDLTRAADRARQDALSAYLGERISAPHQPPSFFSRRYAMPPIGLARPSFAHARKAAPCPALAPGMRPTPAARPLPTRSV